MSDLNRAHIQKYDGKKEMYDKFEAQVLEVVVILGCENALDKNLRRTCPTDTVYAGFDLANFGNDVATINKICQEQKNVLTSHFSAER